MPRRTLLASCLLLASCRERAKPPEPVVDAAPFDGSVAVTDAAVEEDTLAQAIAELEDASSDVRPLEVDVAISSVEVTPKGALDRAMDTLARERWRFRACGRLAEDGGTAPTSVTIRIGESGEPVWATAAPGSMGECLTKAGRAITFPEPVGGLATAVVSIRWTRRVAK